MRSVLPTLWSALLLNAGPALAQSATPALASQWGWGARVGLGFASGQYRDGSGRANDFSNNGFLGGLAATRYLTGPRVSLGLEAVVENPSIYVGFRQGAPSPTYSPQTLAQWRLFVPLFLRTGTPANRLHLLAGGGPTFRLGHPDSDAAYYSQPAEITLVVGAEVRLAPWHRYETTIGFRLHTPITPSYAYGYPQAYTNQGSYVAHEARQDVYSRWIGFTFGTMLYPAASRTR